MIVVLLILVLYIIFILFLLAGWRRALTRKDHGKESDQTISVIIPIRNEASTIGLLINDLQQQSDKNFEIIVVDDGSTDGSREVVERTKSQNLRVIENAGIGKKQAITTGVNNASGKIIVTTDGDCRVPAGWLAQFREVFGSLGIVMAFGGVAIRSDGKLFSDMQSIELASLIGTSGSTSSHGLPLMCSGANLAYRKEVFHEVNGYASNYHIASGDDEFLLRHVAQKYPAGVRFVNNKECVVQTLPQKDAKSFFSQRLRWAGKWRYNSSRLVNSIALFVLLSQIATIGAALTLATGFAPAYAIVLGSKLILEAIFLFQVSSFLSSRWNWVAFLCLQLTYPFYVIFVGVCSLFVRTEWKGRKIK